MKFFNVKNNETGPAIIDIVGKDIGSSWWSDSYGVEDAKEDINGITSNEIILNISSYGGDLHSALTIHDLFKSHKAKVTANIYGATASAATIIATSADTVRMSVNSMYLPHFSRTEGYGTADDLEQAVESLRKHDEAIVNIYEAKTGQSREDIKNVLAKDQWMNAEEALEFGFIDEIFTPAPAAASLDRIDKEAINKSPLPKITNMAEIDENKIVESLWSKFKAKFGKEAETPSFSNEAKELIDSTATEIKNQFQEATDELEGKIENLTSTNATLSIDIEAKEKEITELQTKLAKLEASKEASNGNDPNPENEAKKPQPHELDGYAARIKSKYNG